MEPGIGALISGGLNLMGDLFTQTSARSAYQSRYQDEVADMRKAGLNPALAYGANPGSPNTATFSGLGDATMSGYQAAQQAKETAARTDLTQSQANLLKAQSADLVDQVKLRNYLINADVNLRGEQLSNLNVDTSAKTIARDRSLATYDSDIQGRKARNQSAVTAAQIMKQELPQAQSIGNWFRAHPDLGGWLNSAGGLSKLMSMMPAIPAE